ncbi:helix-turn-helix domain-containing protein [Orenia metallireducens]|uniref:helix-turn-helix domain-containing protein n=1 Tax=Orenia metallireducens TaxID=1413210 RepID=UPI00263B655A|nr:helix-turn-helix domain-containing protein [Orenia metallireducens]
MKNKFKNNKAELARELGVSRTTVSKAISRGKAGSKFFGGLMEYCEANNLNFRDYVLLSSEKEKKE